MILQLFYFEICDFRIIRFLKIRKIKMQIFKVCFLKFVRGNGHHYIVESFRNLRF